jgi:glycosyltransferase involved in cell wall biosynthesis
MRILIFTQYFWPENFHINEIAKGLKNRKHEINVLTALPNYPEGNFFPGYVKKILKKQIWEGINIFRVPIFARGKNRFTLAINYISFILSGIFFAPWLLRNKKYDVIFVYAPSPILQVLPAIFYGRLKKIPVVLWVQDLWPESLSATGHIKSKLFLKFLSFFVKFCYSKCDLILTQSEKFIPPIKKLVPDVAIKYHPNSVSNIFYNHPNKRTGKFNFALSEKFIILFAGNIGNAQSLETIVGTTELLKDYEDIAIVMIGSGNKLEWLKKVKKDKNLEYLHIKGHFAIELMPQIMSQASVLISTLADKPIFALTVPNRIQAFLAVGKPIIACMNGEGARIVDEAKAGLTVPAENKYKLAEAILKLYEMPNQQRKEMGKNGRKYFKKHFDGDKLLMELLNHFKWLIIKRGSN